MWNNMKKFISYFIFYLIQFTWGILMNIFGLFVTIFMLITLHKPHRFGANYYFICKKAEGFGFEAGICFVIGADCNGDPIMKHEAGHSVQNMIFGILTPFLCAIPSVIRYWYRELKYYRKGLEPKTDYDDFWVEGQATKLGEKYYSKLFDEKFKKGDNNENFK